MSCQTNTEEGDFISVGISWITKPEGCHIRDVIKTYEGCDLQQVDTSVETSHAQLHMEQQGDVPCIITLQCVAEHRSVINSLLVVSEARTMEVYSASGDYCGTCRGQEDPNASHEGASGNRPFYQKYLKLQCPTTSCKVKLLSLGDRGSVAIACIHVGLQVMEAKEAETDAGLGPGMSIDLKEVQSMMEEMGTTLSPGAQHLMDMVQFQQKSRADTMAGFLPLLMGSGALSGLTNKGLSVSVPHAAAGQPPPSPALSAALEHSLPPRRAPDKSLLSTMMAMTMTPGVDDEHCHPCPAPAPSPLPTTPPPTSAPFAGCGGPGQPNKLAEVVSALMHAPPSQHCAGTSPDLLPFLQSVCCQVAKLRMDDATAAAAALSKPYTPNGPPEVHPCCRGLEEALNWRLQEMEARLRDHLDQRLSSLEQKLDAVLQQVHQTPKPPT